MRWVTALATAIVLTGTIASVYAAKPSVWRCSVQFRDAAGDIVKSDGAGTYVDGQSGVKCSIESNDWLYFTVSGTAKKARSLVVIAQTNGVSSYNTITGGMELDIKSLREAVAPYDVLPWRLRVGNSQFLEGFGQFTGGSSYTDGPALAGTSSLYVVTVDACTWTATMYTTGLDLQTLAHGENGTTQTNPRVALLTEVGIPGYSGSVSRGNFTMPFQVTVRVIGGKPGCPQ